MYANSFHRLVAIGSLYSETFNFSMSIIRKPGTGSLGLPPAEDVLEDVATVVGTWFPKALASGGAGIINQAKLTSLKLNDIGVDGRYILPETNEWLYPTPIAGDSAQTVVPQAACAVSLLSVVPRGRAARGRFYLPPIGSYGAVSTDGRISATAAGQIATSVATLIDSINDVYTAAQTGDSSVGRVGVTSNIGAGAERIVASVKVGRVADTIRSRRTSLDEDYQSAAVPGPL